MSYFQNPLFLTGAALSSLCMISLLFMLYAGHVWWERGGGGARRAISSLLLIALVELSLVGAIVWFFDRVGRSALLESALLTTFGLVLVATWISSYRSILCMLRGGHTYGAWVWPERPEAGHQICLECSAERTLKNRNSWFFRSRGL